MNKYMVRLGSKDPDDQFVEVEATHHNNEGGDGDRPDRILEGRRGRLT